LATVVAQLAKARGGPPLSFQALLAPITNADFDTDSYHAFADGYFLTRNAMRWFWNLYVPDPSARLDPRASPLRAELAALQGVAPALVLVAEHDPLRDEGEAYARKLSAAGVPVTAHRALGLIHDCGLLNLLANVPATRALVAFV